MKHTIIINIMHCLYPQQRRLVEHNIIMKLIYQLCSALALNKMSNSHDGN